MEVEAPLPCTEAGGRALLRMCGRWTDRYFFKNPILLLNPKQPPADILSDDNHEESPVEITNWEEVKWDSIDGWTSEELKFTAMPSSEGGLGNYNGSEGLHVEKHLSIVDPVLQMLTTNTVDHIMKPQVYTKRDATGDGGDRLVQKSGDFFGVATDADNQHGIGRNVERNKIFKQSKTCGGGSGSKPEDDDIDKMQQQQQQQQQEQHVDIYGTGEHLWPSEIAPTHSVVNEDCPRACHWETMFAAMNWMNLPSTMNCNNNSGRITVRKMAVNEQHSLEDTCQKPDGTDGAPVVNYTEQKGVPKLHRNRIWAITCFLLLSVYPVPATVLSISGSSVTDMDSISIALKNAPAPTATTWIIASAAPHHATGNHALLSNFTPEHSDIFLFGGEAEAMPMQVVGRGVVVTETILLPDVWYVPGLAANLVSVSQLADLEYSVAFGRGKCYVRSTMDGTVVGTAHAGQDGLFALDSLRVPLGGQ